MMENRRLTLVEAKAASWAATSALYEYEVDELQSVDVFQLITDLQVWLRFQPLERLLGVYIPAGPETSSGAGILLNSERDLPQTRFTAAHELGHYLLGHRFSVDEATSITDESGQVIHIEAANQWTNSVQEQQANVFAVHLLMPLQLVNAAMLRLGINPIRPKIDGEAVYKISLELGVSFTAAVNRLRELNLISPTLAAKLKKGEAAPWKSRLLSETGVTRSRSDVWALDLSRSGRVIMPKQGDELVVRLPELPSSGYRWSVVESDLLQPITDHFILSAHPASAERFGLQGQRIFVFKVHGHGSQLVRFIEHRSWQSSTVANTCELSVEVQPKLKDLRHGGMYKVQREKKLELPLVVGWP